MKTYISDPLAHGEPIEVTLDGQPDSVLVTVGNSGLRMRRLEYRCTIERRSGDGWHDVSGSPVDPVRSMFLESPLPDVCDAVVTELAAHSRLFVGAFDADSSTQLIQATHPALTDLLQRGSVTLPSSIPHPISAALREQNLTAAITKLLGGRRPARPVVQSLVRSMNAGGVLRVRDLSFLMCGPGLADAHLEALAQPRAVGASMSVVSTEVADLVAAALAPLGHRVHLGILLAAANRADGLRYLRRLALAERAGLDLSGLRQRDARESLDMRVAEALSEPLEADTTWGCLHGLRVGGAESRLRVLTSSAEFTHVATRMGNCLASWGPARRSQGHSFVAVIERSGQPVQALEIAGQTVVQWAGPRNRCLSSEERAPVAAILREHGIGFGTGTDGTPADDPF